MSKEVEVAEAKVRAAKARLREAKRKEQERVNKAVLKLLKQEHSELYRELENRVKSGATSEPKTEHETDQVSGSGSGPAGTRADGTDDQQGHW